MELQGSLALFQEVRSAPVIRANYLDSDRDVRVITQGVELAREFAASKAFAGLIKEELPPYRGRRSAREIRAAFESPKAKASATIDPSTTALVSPVILNPFRLSLILKSEN